MERPWYSVKNIINTILLLVIAPAIDVYRLGEAAFRSLIAVSKKVHFQLLVLSYSKAHRQFMDTLPSRTHGLGQQSIVLDSRCVSWVLQTSLDKIDHLSAFNHLWSMPGLGKFDTTLIFDCFNGLNGCIGFSNGKVVVMQGMEELATAAARGFCRALYDLAAMDPASSAVADLHRRYNKVFPPRSGFSGVPFCSTIGLIHALVGQPGGPRNIKWNEHQLLSEEDIPFARWMMEAAQAGYQQTQGKKVPRWILRFALDSLSQNPPSPTPVVARCLSIIAIDLGCDALNSTTFDERYV